MAITSRSSVASSPCVEDESEELYSHDSSDGSGNDRAKGKRARALSVIDIDDNSGDVPVAETDEAERGMTHESLSNSVLTLSQHRSPLKRLECTNLCILPSCPIHRLHRTPISTYSCL